MKIALILLALFLGIIFFHFAPRFDRKNVEGIFTNPFAKKTIIAPLPKQDPQRDLEGLLREKKIDIVSSPIASDSAILVKLTQNDTLVVFSINKDLPLQVGSLQIVLNKLTIDGRKGVKIDLRFENPIIVY